MMGKQEVGTLMAAQRKNVVRKKRGRPAIRQDSLTTIRLSSELRENADAWAARQIDKPGRSEAILRLVKFGLERTHRRESSRTKRAAKASAMAAQEIDGLGDPLVTDEERRLRKQRLIKGPKEFRDLRKQSREN
jgi:hypothetical protein